LKVNNGAVRRPTVQRYPTFTNDWLLEVNEICQVEPMEAIFYRQKF
jgi:hypothetical protein